jgi:hypothetical protein
MGMWTVPTSNLDEEGAERGAEVDPEEEGEGVRQDRQQRWRSDASLRRCRKDVSGGAHVVEG